MIPRLALAYYGDDFTGSTDVMEVLTWAGLPSVLFLQPPTKEQLLRFPDARVIGIAGDSRSRSPEWMTENLPAVFNSLRTYGAPLNQYKVCSTFDSSPQVGSIGRALELGLEAFSAAWAPIVVGAPRLRRYQAFGNLFARIGPTTFRLDRHPTMSRHPVTPMGESDLRRHLARQTSIRIGLVDLLSLASAKGQTVIDAAVDGGDDAILFDVIDEASLIEVGRLIWENRHRAPFAVASSGLEYALGAYWRAAGLLPLPAHPKPAGEVDRIAVLSGSCSPETAASIRWAMAHGYTGIALNVRQIVEGHLDDSLWQAVSAASSSRGFIFYTALTTDDPNFVVGDEAFRRSLSEHLGRKFGEVLRQSGVRRALVCGGDTSSTAGRQLDITALTAVGPLAPGSPLCRVWSNGPLNGLEIVFKGGQVGGPGFFEEVRLGRAQS